VVLALSPQVQTLPVAPVIGEGGVGAVICGATDPQLVMFSREPGGTALTCDVACPPMQFFPHCPLHGDLRDAAGTRVLLLTQTPSRSA
jgi:hypothetical protein